MVFNATLGIIGVMVFNATLGISYIVEVMI